MPAETEGLGEGIGPGGEGEETGLVLRLRLWCAQIGGGTGFWCGEQGRTREHAQNRETGNGGRSSGARGAAKLGPDARTRHGLGLPLPFRFLSIRFFAAALKFSCPFDGGVGFAFGV